MSQRAKQNYENLTTIQLHKKTREELQKLGAKGDTFEQIVSRLLSENKRERGY